MFGFHDTHACFNKRTLRTEKNLFSFPVYMRRVDKYTWLAFELPYHIEQNYVLQFHVFY